MRFLYLFAGIPVGVFDRVEAARADIVQGDGDFWASPMPGFGRQYDFLYSQKFSKTLVQRLSTDHQNKLADTGIALIYIDFENESVGHFVRALFPAVLMIPVKWQFKFGSPNTENASVNVLKVELKKAARKAKLAITALKQELTKHQNTTPALLPVKNFRSTIYVDALRVLERNLNAPEGHVETLASFVETVKASHKPVRLANEGRKGALTAFADDAEVFFAPPGRDHHAFSRPAVDHADLCLLSGRRRLGAPYAPAFHYDCTRMGEPLEGYFTGCHEDERHWKGKPHINIAPNDYLRV